MTSPKLNFSLEKNSSAIIYAKGEHPALEVETHFGFMLNVSKVQHGTSDVGLELVPGLQLRRATEAEVAAIKDVLERQAGTESCGIWEKSRLKEETPPDWSDIPHFHSLSKEEWETAEHWGYDFLPKEEWKYFVVAFSGSNSTLAALEKVFAIAPVELKLGFTLVQSPFQGEETNSPVLILNPGRLFSQVKRSSDQDLPFVEITEEIASDILNLHQKLQTCDHLSNVVGFLEQMLGLDALPYKSPLLFLGYFAILESLLTHEPKPTDTIDSITRQVKRKLTLLDNRWKPRLEYSAFKGAAPDKIWSQMYGYRSALAHGSEPDFKGELKLLNERSALTLLRQAVKALLRQAIIEPQLIFDLRNC